ncbi:hypothetical protein WJX74_006400 [Apatococcus lobatus]|uniref:AB hydrolase-1 domain-containing protein n=1 Tax=Apatococcus lobatus TaxID=904363 RepID=A0AAW1QJN9_9CHLO
MPSFHQATIPPCELHAASLGCRAQSCKPTTARPHDGWHSRPGVVVLSVKASATAYEATSATSTQSWRHELPCGLHLEMLRRSPRLPATTRGVLLFVHGARHGAWCWEEHFLGFFAEHGWDAFAMSLRSHGGSDMDDHPGCMTECLEDLQHVIKSLPQPPVLVAHSMSGLILQQYLIEVANGRSMAHVTGVALLCSAGMLKAAPDMQYFQAQSSLWHLLKVVWWMLSKSLSNIALNRQMLFSSDIPLDMLRRYQRRLENAPNLLAFTQGDVAEGVKMAEGLARPISCGVPVFAISAGNDGIIMPHQVEDGAAMFGAHAHRIPGLAHDLMLCERWESAAVCLEDWLETIPGSTSLQQQPLQQAGPKKTV